MHLPHPTFLAGLACLRKLSSHLYGMLIGMVTSCVLGHALCNCGTRTTAGTPTAVYWYATLIKKIDTHKKDKRFKKQTIQKPQTPANTQHCRQYVIHSNPSPLSWVLKFQHFCLHTKIYGGILKLTNFT
jgi:hypothetical protein